MRVGIPMSYSPDNYTVDPITGKQLRDGRLFEDPSSYRMKGLYIEYYEGLARLAGFTMVYHPISVASASQFSSSWTACAYDVVLGHFDFCVGNFWVTSERASLGVNFLNPTSQEEFRLLHLPPGAQNNDGFHLFAFAAPFTSGVWLMLISSFFIAGFMYYYLSAEESFVHDRTIKT